MQVPRAAQRKSTTLWLGRQERSRRCQALWATAEFGLCSESDRKPGKRFRRDQIGVWEQLLRLLSGRQLKEPVLGTGRQVRRVLCLTGTQEFRTGVGGMTGTRKGRATQGCGKDRRGLCGWWVHWGVKGGTAESQRPLFRLRDWEALSLLTANAEQMLSPSPFFLPPATLKQTCRDLVNSRQVTLVEVLLCVPCKVH